MATYQELVKKARGMSLQLTKKQQKEIIGIYEGALGELSKKAKAAKDKSLTERWTTDYLKEVTRAKDELERQLNKSMTNSIKQAAKNAILPDLALFKSAQARAGIDIGPHFTQMFSQVPSDTLAGIVKGDLYRDGKGLSQRIWNTTNNLGNDIDYMIKKAMVEGKSACDLAKDLETFVKPEHQRPWDWGNVYPNLRTRQIDCNAQRLARTSITHAHRESQHKSAAQNPFVDAVHWELSDAHYERQVARWGPDECDDYANQDWYGLGKGNFPPDEVPLSHPQCLCYTYPVISKSLDQIADELKAWVDGDNEDLDRFFEGDVVNVNSKGYNKSEETVSGGISGARNPSGDKAKEHAERYYESVRKMTTDVSRIAQNTGYSEEEIKNIKKYLFIDSHEWKNNERLDPDYMIGESWRRLSTNDNIQPHDITFIKHELLERALLEQGFTQDDAHIKATERYDYDGEANDFYAKIKKYKKD